MEDGQDRQDGGEIGDGSAAMPPVEPPIGPVGEVVESPGCDDASDDPDEDGLTGVLAALEEPDPDEAPASEQPATAEPVAVSAEIVSDTEEGASEPVAEPEAPLAETAPATAETAVTAAVVDAQQAYADATALPEEHRGVPIWPFLVYFSLWVVFAGLLVWQFMQTPAGVPLYELALYGPSILAGLFLTALGPLLAIGVWIMLWLARPGARAGLFSRSFILGAVVTLAGVALWLVALGAVDMLRLGRLI